MESGNAFAELPASDQDAVREAQKRKKNEKALAKAAARAKKAAADAAEGSAQAGAPAAGDAGAGGQPAGGGDLLAASTTYPTRISMDEYFGACPGGGFRDPNLPPTEESLSLLMQVLQADGSQAASLNSCSHFQFSGSDDALWDPTFNARLAWEGFFTITTTRRVRRGKKAAKEVREPLPELQPFYGVLTWANFHAAKHVRTHLTKMRKRMGLDESAKVELERMTEWRLKELLKRDFDYEDEHFVEGGTAFVAAAGGWGAATKPKKELVEEAWKWLNPHTKAPRLRQKRMWVEDSPSRRSCWQRLQDYHNSPARAEHGDNWLTERYFDMMVAASDDPSNNYRMHTILLMEEDEAGAEGGAGVALAGEIGFSIGRVYTSLSGWTGERTAEAHGTSQLVLLGLWLEERGFAFWSLGHCYSPELEYKRALGHRIYPRYRGQFLSDPDRSCAKCGGSEPEAGPPHKACARCGTVWYCGRECQTAHWKKKGGDHKAVCVPKPAEETGTEGFTPLEPGERADAFALLAE